MHKTFICYCLCFTLCTIASAKISAAELYLPLNLDPAIEAKIERVLSLANNPTNKRPIPVLTLKQALNKLEGQHVHLTAGVQNYLRRFERKYAISHAAFTASSSSGAAVTRSNQRGADTQSRYTASATAYWNIASWLAINAGGYAHDNTLSSEGNTLENSYISIGNRYFQADIGYRPHWFGPFQESDMLHSTNAASSPGITFSNAEPITLLNISYEMFFTEMSTSDNIRSEDRTQRLSGKPKLFGLHLGFAPLEGFALGVNRLMQYGGADRKDSLSDLYNAFVDPKTQDNVGIAGNDFGNQLSSITASYTFVGSQPIKLYMEYAGEDTSLSSEAHLGNSALMFGLHLPLLTDSLDFSYEYAEWQNAWYVSGNYGDGLTQNQIPIGHWGANHRVFPDAVGASAQTARLNWHLQEDKTLITKIQHIENASYSQQNYDSGLLLYAEYSQAISTFTLGAALTLGQSVLGEDFAQFSGIIRW